MTELCISKSKRLIPEPKFCNTALAKGNNKIKLLLEDPHYKIHPLTLITENGRPYTLRKKIWLMVLA